MSVPPSRKSRPRAVSQLANADAITKAALATLAIIHELRPRYRGKTGL